MILSRDDKPYCADCFGELFSKRCTACAKPITGNLYFRPRFSATNLVNTYSWFRILVNFRTFDFAELNQIILMLYLCFVKRNLHVYY